MTYTTRSHAPGATFPVGTTTVTYTFTDGSGNTSTCVFDVIVQDNTPPVISSCPTDITVQTGVGSLTCDQTATWTEPTALDNCAGAMTYTTRSHAPGATFPVGTTTVTYTFTDGSGNTSTCVFDVIVQDNTPPVISSCPTDITVQTGAGRLTCDQTATWTEPTALDNCAGAMTYTTRSHAPGAIFPVGTTTVTYTFTDGSGNTSTCVFDVIVQDNTPPVISSCPADITVQTGVGRLTCDQTATWTEPTALDNCTGAMTYTTRSHAPGATFPVGTTTVTYTFTDGSGNTSTCVFDVIVQDNTPPIITCTIPAASYTVDAGECFYTVPGTSLDPVSTVDNCGVASVINNFNGTSTLAGAQFPTGNTTVIWTVTDIYGNESSCQYIIRVVDNENPIITCPADVIVDCEDDKSPANTGTATAIDNCTATPSIVITFA